MRIIMERGRDLLRRSTAGLGVIAHFGGFSPRDNLPVSSPHIRRAILDLSEGGSTRLAANLPSECTERDRPLAYRVRIRLVEGRAHAGPADADAVTATHFDVVSADPGLLTFLGQHSPGFHVFELRCAGLETLWRGDLAKVQETRRPVRAGMTVYLGAEAIELEHLAYPVLESSRILEIRGWFDETCGNPMPSIDWRRVRHVRRNERSRTVTLPGQLTRTAANSGTGELSGLYAEDPGLRARLGAGSAHEAELEGRCQLSRSACGQRSGQ